MAGTYPIYHASKGGRDDYCGSVEAYSALHAVTRWAKETGVDDYTLELDSALAGRSRRVMVCPARSAGFYYTYAELGYEA